MVVIQWIKEEQNVQASEAILLVGQRKEGDCRVCGSA